MICLTTVTTEDFLPGVLVMISSFLDHNPWFDGDIVVIDAGLKPASKDRLRKLTARLRFISPSQELVDAFSDDAPLGGQGRYAQAKFASLEMFRLDQYEQVLFCDADMLFRGEIRAALNTKGDIVATADGPNMRGNGRDRDGFSEVGLNDVANPLCNTFNAGFLVLSKAVRDDGARRAVFDFLRDDFWKTCATGHTDQAVLNHVFEGRVQFIGGEYNFLLGHYDNAVDDFEGGLEQAKVLHYNCRVKPWVVRKTPPLHPAQAKANAWWMAEYSTVLGKLRDG